jgi:hypothetical protein
MIISFLLHIFFKVLSLLVNLYHVNDHLFFIACHVNIQKLMKERSKFLELYVYMKFLYKEHVLKNYHLIIYGVI